MAFTAQASSVPKVIILLLALVSNVAGVTQTLFNDVGCNPAKAAVSCTSLAANRCCRSAAGVRMLFPSTALSTHMHCLSMKY